MCMAGILLVIGLWRGEVGDDNNVFGFMFIVKLNINK